MPEQVGVTSKLKKVLGTWEQDHGVQQHAYACKSVMAHSRSMVCDGLGKTPVPGEDRTNMVNIVNLSAILYYAELNEQDGSRGFRGITLDQLRDEGIEEALLDKAKDVAEALGSTDMDSAIVQHVLEDDGLKAMTLFAAGLIRSYNSAVTNEATRERLAGLMEKLTTPAVA